MSLCINAGSCIHWFLYTYSREVHKLNCFNQSEAFSLSFFLSLLKKQSDHEPGGGLDAWPAGCTPGFCDQSAPAMGVWPPQASASTPPGLT